MQWEKNRQDELQKLQAQGLLAIDYEMDKLGKEGKITDEIEDQSTCRPTGVVAALVNKPDQSAAEIIDEIVGEAKQLLEGAHKLLRPSAKL